MAVKYGISIKHLYTEAGHGKSPCDGVGGNVKTEVEAALQNEYGNKEVTQIESAEDIKKLIEEKNNLTYDITVHDQETSQKIDDKLPKLGPLVGAQKIHEIVITPQGVVKKKNLPNEISYSIVNIRESRKKRKTDVNEAPDELEHSVESVESLEQSDRESDHVE